jgi:hypothetical protein
MSLSERWKTRTLGDGEWLRVDFGPLRIVVMNCREEWRVVALTENDAFPDGPSGRAEDAPRDLAWQRWDHDPKDSKISFRPAFPTMPVVARPHNLLHLSPKGDASFFVGIPASIEILAECQGVMRMLIGIPTQVLSKTWHGTPLVGKLGFALRTYSRRYFDPGEWPEFDIVCPVNIVNDRDSALPFERLYLETDHLSVFEKDGRLWSNAARIRVAAEDTEMTNITYASRPAAPYEDAAEVTPPRKGRARHSTMRSAFSRMLGQFNPLDESL